MRKLFMTVALSIMITSSILSEVFDSTLGETGLSTDLTVTFDPSALNIVDIGFSRNEINSIGDEVYGFRQSDIEDLIIDGDTATYMNSIYIYWRIMSSSRLSATLSIDEPLKGANGEIDWEVRLVEENKSISSDEDNDLELDFMNPEHYYGTAGSSELSIGTKSMNYGGLLPGEYTGELRLNIKTE